jgi:Flp pilus assembly pilin Flp
MGGRVAPQLLLDMATIRRLISRLLRETSGQDLIEFGLLASIIAIAGILLFPTIATKMGNAFVGWGQNVNNSWVPSDPVP